MKGLWRSLAALLGAAALTVGLAACGDEGGTGAAGEKVSLRLGYVTTAQHPYGVAIDALVKEVNETSGGRITITTVPNYQGGDIPLLDDVSAGTIEMAGVSTAVWDGKGVNVFQPLQAPFLITNYPLSQTVLGGEIGQKMLDSSNGPAKLGLVGLGILEGGLRLPVGADKAFRSLADFRGAKIRTPQSQVLAAGLQALGAESTPIPVGDVYTALQNGTVDGMEANYGLIYTNKYDEVAKFVTRDVVLWPFPAAVVINQAQFDKLSDDDKKILQDAGKNLAANSVNVFLSPAPAINFVAELCKRGLTYAIAGDANRAALAKAAESAYAKLEADSEVAGLIADIRAAKEAAGPPSPPPPLPAGCKTLT
jgi:TRAP-type C4-dicarboxylate transport system, periplasmic component